MEISIWEIIGTIFMIPVSIFGWMIAYSMLKKKMNIWSILFLILQILYTCDTLYKIGSLIWKVIQ